MAFRSDTNSRDLPNTWDETVLDGEVNGYDRSLSVPYTGDIGDLEEEFSDLEAEVFEVNRRFRDRVKILYRLEDQEDIYNSLR